MNMNMNMNMNMGQQTHAARSYEAGTNMTHWLGGGDATGNTYYYYTSYNIYYIISYILYIIVYYFNALHII